VFNPDEVRSAVIVAADRAWVQHGGTLSLIARGNCPGTPAGPRTPQRQRLCQVEQRAVPGRLPGGAVLRDVDGGRFIFESAAYRWDGRDWRRIDNAPGIGVDVPAAVNAKDELVRAVGDGNRLDLAVMEPAGSDVKVSRPTLAAATPLRFEGAMTAERLPALGDARGQSRWLRFDRSTRQFQVRSAQQGSVNVSASDLFPGRVFAPTLSGRSVITGPQTFVHANEAGLWKFPLRYDWVENGPAWTRVALPPPVAAARGRFYFAQGADVVSIAVDGAGVEPDRGEYVLANDGLTITENIRSESIAATIDAAGQPVNTLAPAGFLHDQRQGIAFSRNGAVVATPAGIVNARDFHALPLPPGWAAAPPGDAALFNADGLLHAKAGRRIFAAGGNSSNNSSWSEAAADPRQAPRTLARDGGREWQRDGDTVAVRGREPSDGWRARLAAGWRFTADQVEGAVHTARGSIVAATREGIVEAQDLDGLTAAAPSRNRPEGANGMLERHFQAPGSPVTGFVYRDGSGGRRSSLVMDDRSDWAAPQDDPLISRAAVRAAPPSMPLSITFTNEQAFLEAVAERPQMGGQSSRPTTVAVDWRRGEHFPFDQATAIAADGDTLHVGTEAGLLITSAASPPSKWRLVDTGKGDRTPVKVDRIGRPASARTRLVARSGAGCLDLAGPGVTPCADPQALDERWLGGTGYWQWIARGRPEMVYLDAAGRAAGSPLTSPGYGFPHDRPIAAVDCPGQGRITLWGDGLALAAPGPGWSLGGRAAVSDLRRQFPAAPTALHCQPAGLPLPGGKTAAAGVRALSPSSGNSAIHDNGAWRVEPEEIATAIIKRWNGEIPYDRSRLRLAYGEGKGSLKLEYFTRSQQWRPLRAGSTRFLVDERQRIVSAGGTSYALTPEGLIRLERSGGYRINPDTLDIIAVPCEVDWIETADGHGFALAKEPGEPTLVRCRDGQVLEGKLLEGKLLEGSVDGAGSEGPAFTARRSVDPFIERSIPAAGSAIAWRIVDRKAGLPGSLEATWRGERLPLAGGRFGIDVWRSFAHIGNSAFVDMASGQGWIRSPRQNLSLGQAQRPAVPTAVAKDVRQLAIDVDLDRQEVLCLVLDRTGQTAFQRFSWSAGGEAFGRLETRDCGRFEGGEGSHGPWTYRAAIRVPSALDMRAPDQSGAPIERILSDGRFTDLVATGAPLSFMAQGSTMTLIPTLAGVTRITAAGEELPVRTFNVSRAAGATGSGATGASAPGSPAIALLATGAGDLEVLTADGFSGSGNLRQTCPVERKLADLGAIRFGALGMTGDGLMEMSGRRGADRVFYALACGAGQPAVLPWWIAVDVAGRRRVTANRLPWSRIWLHWAAGDLSAGARPAPDVLLGQNLRAPLRFLNGGDRVFAVLRDDVLEIAVDPLVSALSGRH
jgi:hypothetical protein